MKLKPILTPQELLDTYDNPYLVIVFAGNGEESKKYFEEQHLQGAQYIDLEELYGALGDPKNGGRHPLPTTEEFSKTIQKLGISNDSHIVIYDDKKGANAAARLWWMLRSAGLNNVQVLDGGCPFLRGKLEFPKETGASSKNSVTHPHPLPLKEWLLPMIDIDGIKRLSYDDDALILDVRESGRYRGDFEPIDPIAGHIPSATNLPFLENLDDDGYFKHPNQLRTQFEEVLQSTPSEKTAVHCGSGVTACHTLLAMDYAGLPLPNLYVGSWSEWCRNNQPISTDATINS